MIRRTLKKMRRNNSEGFTLIELMIVVAIIGILAAIAIPNFIRYQLKSKTSEAKTNLKAIATSQVAYQAEHNGFISMAAAVPIGGGKSVKTAWGVTAAALNPGTPAGNGGGAGNFEDIGFRPAGSVYYLYQCATGADTAKTLGQCVTADAVSDLDGNGVKGAYAIGLYDVVGNAVAGPQSKFTPTNSNAVQDGKAGEF